MSNLTVSNEITEALDQVVQRVQRSLVVVQNGRRGAGAGVVWRHSGVILTNNHVIQSRRPRVILPDGQELPAEVLDRDPEVDLALLSVERQDLPAALVADSQSLRVGDLVLAIGHPWGQRNYVTMGVVSALGQAQTRGPRKQVPIIRSDVMLAPGNSGGPLLNARGAVVGINAMVVGGDQGVAIPSQVASGFVKETLDRQVALGVGVQATPLPAGLPALSGGTGLLVVELTPDGPAEQAGLLPGDILVEVDGRALEGPRALLRVLAERRPGESIPLRLVRAGRLETLEAELSPRERML